MNNYPMNVPSIFHYNSDTMNAITCVTLFVVVAGVLSLQLIPERAYVKYINEKYAHGTKFYVRRHGRKSLYYFNLEGTSKQEWGNNVSAHFYFYEYLHNEYKRSFVELHYTKMCDWLNKDPYIGAAIRENKCDVERKKQELQSELCEGALKCPVPAGYYKFNNISVPSTDFPNVWPFERFRVDCSLRAMTGDELMFEVQAYLSIKQTSGK